MPASSVIDYDRGVIIIQHSVTGMDVFMYVDDPGKFLDAHGNAVPDSIAKEAGYDTEKLSVERTKKERKARANELIDAELADDKDVKHEVINEEGGYQVVSTGLGRHHVLDPEGNRLNNFPLSLEQAEKLMQNMAGAIVEVSPDKKKSK